MYKRRMKQFKSRKLRKNRKQSGGLGQPLNYTDASHQEPSANAGFNRLGVEAPYLVRPALDAIPFRGGEQILSPMAFRDAYHSDPLAPTGQPLTDMKFPATLRQGLTFGGGKRKSRRKNRRSRKSKGGFFPSIMGGVVSNAPLLAPLAARQSMLLFEKYRKATRKSTRRSNSGRRA